MKKALTIVLASLLACSCHFLEIEKVGKSDIQTYFSEITALEPAINGVMNLSYKLYDSYLLLYPSIASDEVSLTSAASAAWQSAANFSLLPTDDVSILGYLWKDGYNIISNCNQILDNAPALKEKYPRESDLVDNVMAQALFIRALMHFEICRCYGQNYSFTPDASHLGVPIVDHPLGATEKIDRRSVAEVYARIISDLQKAQGMFSADYTKGVYFASPLACKALLARVYLYKNDWENALKYASEVIDAKPLTSRATYLGMYEKAASVADDECILRLGGYGAKGQTTFKFYYYESAHASKAITDLLSDPKDVRGGLVAGKICGKYTCTDNVTSDDQRYYNPVLLRVSEMYLIRAEALCRRGDIAGALKDVTAIEERALGAKPSFTAASVEEMMALIETERMKELCFEGHRFYDLARWHKSVVRDAENSSIVKTLEYPDYRFALPIPQIEISANEYIKQNEGYEE